MYNSENVDYPFTISDEGIKVANKNFYFVKSKSIEGKWYQVKREENENIWQCDCPDFRNRVRKGIDDINCKHIRLAQFQRQSLEYNYSPNNDERPKICDLCYSQNIKKGGKRKLVSGEKRQRHMCKDCGHRFLVGENGFRKLKNDPRIVSEAIDLHIRGMSFRDISKHFLETTGWKFSHVTVLNWVKKYMRTARDYLDSNFSPQLSDIWCVDEMMINVKHTRKTGKGFYVWLWSVIDPQTKFVIACLISKQREINDAEEVLLLGRKIAGKDPKYIITDLLKPYQRAITEVFGKSRVAHIKTKSLAKGFENRAIERYHNEFRSVKKSNRGFGNDESVKEAAEDYRMYHNYLRSHTGLPNNITPAEAAGIKVNLGQIKIHDLINKSTECEYNFAIQLGKRIKNVDIVNEKDCIRVIPKSWIEKNTWREINDILGFNGFGWLSSERGGYWIK